MNSFVFELPFQNETKMKFLAHNTNRGRSGNCSSIQKNMAMMLHAFVQNRAMFLDKIFRPSTYSKLAAYYHFKIEIIQRQIFLFVSYFF